MTAYTPPEGHNPPATSPPPPAGYPPPPPAGYPPPPPPTYPQAPAGAAGQPPVPNGSPQGFRPPPPPGVVPTEPAPPVAWLIPLAALLAVIGAFTPWFTPEASVNGRTIDAQNSLYSWKDGKVGLIAPIVLVIIGFTVFGLLRGKRAGRFAAAADPVKAAGRYAAIAGVVSGVCLVIAWFLVTSQYTFNGLSWDELEKRLAAAGGTLSRGPQIGYFLTIAAAALAIIGGVLMMTMSKRSTPATNATPPPPSYGPAPSLEKSPPPQA